MQHSRSRLPPIEAWLCEGWADDLLSHENAVKLFGRLNSSHSPAYHHGYTRGAGTLHTIVCIPRTREMLIGVGGDVVPTRASIARWLNGENLSFKSLSGQLGGTKDSFRKGEAAQENPPRRPVALV